MNALLSLSLTSFRSLFRFFPFLLVNIADQLDDLANCVSYYESFPFFLFTCCSLRICSHTLLLVFGDVVLPKIWPGYLVVHVVLIPWLSFCLFSKMVRHTCVVVVDVLCGGDGWLSLLALSQHFWSSDFYYICFILMMSALLLNT